MNTPEHYPSMGEAVGSAMAHNARQAARSQPSNGPITARELAAELGLSGTTVEAMATELETVRPRPVSTVYLAYRERLLSGEAADVIRAAAPGPVAVGALASELGVSISGVERGVRDLEMVLSAGGIQAAVWSDGMLTPYAAARIRAVHDAPAVSSGTTIPALARELGLYPATVGDMARDLISEGRLIVWTDRGILSDAAADAIRSGQSGVPARGLYQDGPERATFTVHVVPAMLKDTSVGDSLERIASLMIRLELERDVHDPRQDTERPGDADVLAWAVATAGHLFDHHVLWDYDLVTNAEHAHRCIDYRHDGPNTRGGTGRG